jgi:hypothetical protein
MKIIFYLADSLSPSAIINPNEKKKFFNLAIKNNYINQLAKNSAYFENCYGYGETISVTSSMMTGNNPYINYSDSFFLINSLRVKNELSLFFKKKNFYNIYYSNVNADYPSDRGFYKRYFNLSTQNYDIKLIKKKRKNYNFSNFFKDNNLLKIHNKYENIFYFIHENFLHDNPGIYRNCSPKNYLKGVDQLSLIMQQQLKLIDYNNNSDIIYFLSDHGMTLKPYDQIHFNNNLSEKDYNIYYKEQLNDQKIKFCFFIKSPHQKKINIKNYITPEKILFWIKNSYLNLKIKPIKNYNKNIIVSCRAASKSKYLNIFDKLCFHNHFLYISDKRKISFNQKHPDLFWDLSEKKVPNYKINNKFLSKIKKYYSFKNKILKFFLLFITFITRIFYKFFLLKK